MPPGRRAVALTMLVLGALLLTRGAAIADGAALLRSLAPFYDSAEPPPNMRAWDTGWQRLCVDHRPPAISISAPSPLAGRALTAALASGDYPAAQKLARAGTSNRPADATLSALFAGRWIEAADSLDPPSGLTDRTWGSVLYVASQIAASQRDFARADAFQARAEPLYGADGPLDSSALATCLTNWGRDTEARAELRRASVSVPATPSTLAALASTFLPDVSPPQGDAEWLPASDAHPEFRLAAAPGGASRATGVDVDTNDLDHSPVLRVTTYWTAEQTPDQVLVRRDVVRDLVANGGFVWDYVSDGRRPFGFTTSLYHNTASSRFITRDDGRRAVCLRRPAVDESVGLEGTAFHLSNATTTTVVQGGEVMSPSGAGFGLAHRWAGTLDEHPYSFVGMAPSGPSAWTRFAAADVLPAGSTTVRAWLMNTFGPAGAEVCFSHLFMFELPPPP